MLCDDPLLLRHQRYGRVAQKRLELSFLAGMDRRPKDADDHGTLLVGCIGARSQASRVLGELCNVRAGSRSTCGSNTSSILASSSSCNLTPEAAALSSTCSGRDAPMIALATLSFWSTHATANWAIESPASLASGSSCWTRSKTSSLNHRLIMFAPPFSSVAREPDGGCSPGRYFPVSTPWAIGEKTICDMPSETETGTTSLSITRHSMEYCGWLEIMWKPSSSARSWPSWIC